VPAPSANVVGIATRNLWGITDGGGNEQQSRQRRGHGDRRSPSPPDGRFSIGSSGTGLNVSESFGDVTGTSRHAGTRGRASAAVLALSDPEWPDSHGLDMVQERAGEELPT
jgi:hypothetical protein